MGFDLLLALYLLLIAPKILIERLKGKRHPELLQRFGAKIPDPGQREVIWIHAVSVGEAKAAQPLFFSLKKEYPTAFFLVTTTTATGQAEAKRSMPDANAYRYLPLDFSWVVRRWANRLRPRLFLLIESDFWPNLLSAIQRVGGKTILVSGKLSERSAKRFAKFPSIGISFFSRLDLLLVQNETQHARFLPFVDPSRLHKTGNLKFDFQPQPVLIPDWAQRIHRPILTIASTHAPEEEKILEALEGLDLFLMLAPRHPERFEEVAQLLHKKKIPFVRWSNLSLNGEKVLLVDAMGQLPICYSLSHLAIVGGSFTPKVGGHNVLEPCFYNTPVLFGPYMHKQTELATRVLESGAGIQVALEYLCETVTAVLQTKKQSMLTAAASLISQGGRTLETTLSHIFLVLQGSLQEKEKTVR